VIPDPCGSIDPATDPLRLESGKSNIQWEPLHEFFMMPNDLLATIERLAIFDCCYAGAAVRSVSEITSELIAPRGNHEIARNRRYNSIKIVPRHKEPCNRKVVYEFRGNNRGSEECRRITCGCCRTKAACIVSRKSEIISTQASTVIRASECSRGALSLR
jgi:hypothetical protein